MGKIKLFLTVGVLSIGMVIFGTGAAVSVTADGPTAETVAADGTLPVFDQGRDIVDAQATIESPVPPLAEYPPAGSAVPIEINLEGNTSIATVTFGAVEEFSNQNARLDATLRDTDGSDSLIVYVDTANPGGPNDGFIAGEGTEIVDTKSDLNPGFSGPFAGGVTYDIVVTPTDEPHYVEGSVPTDQSAVRLTEQSNTDNEGSATVEQSVTSNGPSQLTVQTEITDAPTNNPVTVPVATTVAEEGAEFETRYSLEEISFTPRISTPTSVGIRTMDTPSGGASGAELGAAGTTSLGYFNVTTDLDSALIDSTEFVFEVDRDTIEDAGSAPEGVALYRYDPTAGTWNQTDTDILSEDNGPVRFQSTADRFSQWAVAAKTPQFEIAETDLSSTSVTTDETVDVEATVTNTGGLPGEYEAGLSDGENTIGTETVSVDPAASETVQFEHTFTEPGTYEITIGDTVVGEVTVEEAESSEDGTGTGEPGEGTDSSETTDESEDETGDDGGPGFGIGAVLAALTGTGYLAKRKTE